jgi:alkanesulfonate monooxygenase SsuD/methylene tetrahydromethanopterin reductase-like flavin-dependent oxidoreductase (luciferase family)
MDYDHPVRFGIFPSPRADFSQETLHMARVADEAGFDLVGIQDHPYQRRFLDTWALMGFVLAKTDRVTVFPDVANLPLRPPRMMAKHAATLDHLSGGRFDLGLGWGSVPAELATFGLLPEPAAVRSQRLEETLEILELLFTGETVDYDGRHYQLHGAQQRPRPLAGRVPVLIGGIGETLTLPLVRRFADWWNCPSYGISRLEEVRPLVGDVKVSTQHPIGLAVGHTDRADVVALAEKRFGNWGGLIAGTPDEVAAELAREAAIGVELFLVPFSDFGTVETIERFGREVMPAVRAAAGA